MVRRLDKENSLALNFLSELRDEVIQKDSMRFRRNLERIGEIMAYEVSKTLDYTAQKVTTPLGEAESMFMNQQVVLMPILRSAVPMCNGMLNFFDRAEVGFVGAYRHYRKNGQLEIRMDHISTPCLDDKVLIIIDPMIATSASMAMTYEALLERGGIPSHTHICSVLGSSEGIENLEFMFGGSGRVTIWSVSIDSEMTIRSYIVPGIGDTGDLAYGIKL